MNKKFISIGLIFLAIVIFSVFKIEYKFLSLFRHDLSVNLVGSFLAGALLTLTLFILNEYVFKVNLTGEWEIIETIAEAKVYQGYKVHYTFHILQKGSNIVGYGEKTKEFQNNEVPMVFERTKRVRVEFEGYIEKGYVSETKIYLLIYEYGRERETSSTYFLKIKDQNTLSGYFSSTAADAKGPLLMKKQMGFNL